MPVEIVKIDETSYRLEHGMVRSTLFIGTDKALLVDTGFGDGVKAAVESLTDKPVMLVITHADGDHTGGCEQFGEVYMGADEFDHFHAQKPDVPAKLLKDGEIIDIGNRQFEIIDIPGHTNGSIALLDRANRIIITGDSLSSGAIFMFGEQRDIKKYIQSMERLDKMTDLFDTVYPSHGDFPVAPQQIRKSIIAAEKLLAGELTGEDSMFPGGAKVYMHDGAGFLYSE